MLLQDTNHPDTADSTDRERVRAAIGRLSPAERDLLVLRFRDGLATAELAAATGTSAATVERRLHHAAWVVEDVAGPSALRQGPPRPRPTDLVVEEAAMGITPLLAARLVAAVAGSVPPEADDRWRWHGLVAALQRQGEGVLTMALAAAVALPAMVSLAS